jgi:hypothetical protein
MKKKMLPRKKASIKSKSRLVNGQWIRITQQTVTAYSIIDINPRSSDRFVLEQKLYQQYKLMKIRVEAVPLLSEGNSPKAAYMKFSVNGEVPSESSIQQTGYFLNPSKSTVKFFRLGGKQNDFNYWFDTTTSDRPTVKLYIKPQNGPETNFNVTVSIQIKFRQRIVPTTDTVNMIREMDEEKEEIDIDEEIKKLTNKLNQLKKLKK